MMPNLSLIIPFYNAANYLSHCVECIKKQDYDNYEVIMVDDGSSDDSYRMCMQLTQGDDRFVVLQQENSGPSSARNLGLDNVHGNYICFMDVDDEIDANYLSSLVKDGATGADLVIQDLTRISYGHAQNRGLHVNGTYNLQSQDDVEDFFSDINIERFGGPYCKLYDADLLKKHKIRFNVSIRLAEDLDFLLRYICVCNSIRLSSQCNYRYLNNEGSASSHLYSFDDEYSGMCALIETWNKLTERFDVLALVNLRIRCVAYYVYRCLFASETIADLQSIPSDYVSSFRQYWQANTIYLKMVKWTFVHRYFWLTNKLLLLSKNKA